MPSTQNHMPHFLGAETGKLPRVIGKQIVAHCCGTYDYSDGPLWRREAALRRSHAKP